ncbi:MAG TPA: rhodanese-like domain-containing protein [Propionibacteriaceae bacterium]
MQPDEIPTVTNTEARALVDQGWMLVDVRSDDEWAQARVPGAVHIPMEQVMTRLDEIGPQVVCMCAVGGRSARVTQYLNVEGKTAVNLDGGIYRWAEDGLPVETGA